MSVFFVEGSGGGGGSLGEDTVAAQQCVDGGILTAETAVKLGGILRAATLKHVVTE